MTLYTALITPFLADGSLNQSGLLELIDRQVIAHVDGLVVAGSTGEGHALSSTEKAQLISLTRNNWQKELSVGCGESGSEKTLVAIKEAADLGANSALVISPLCNKPTQEGLLRHFTYLADHSPIPLIVYNHPGRTGVNILPDTLKKICCHPNISAVKEASGDLTQVMEVIQNKIALFAGDDSFTYPLMQLGAQGVVSMASNLIPEEMRTIVAGDRTTHFRWLELFQALNYESNPIPLKYAMDKMGLPAGKPRLPLTPLSSLYRTRLEALLPCPAQA